MSKDISHTDNIKNMENIYDLSSYIDNLEIIEKINDEKDKLISDLKQDNIYKTILIERLINHINDISELK
tara:strand:- start:4255 stop:4464 length:210 start_codon:yes stop_codon:yes gene_type:complete